jgi:outer membrane protein
MNRLFLVFFCQFIGMNAYAATLSDIYSQALENDYKFKAAQHAYSATLENKYITKSELLPKIYAEGSWVRSETTNTIDSSNPFAVKNKSIQTNNGPGYSVSLTQPLFDMTALHEFKRSELSDRLAILQFEQAKSSLVFRTADAYLRVLNAGAKLAAARSAEDAYQLQLKAAKVKFDVGLANMSDFLDAQARSDSAAAERVSATSNLNTTFGLLKVITGQSHAELADLPEDFVVALPEPADFNPWAEAVEKSNIEINLAKLRVAEAYEGYKARKSEHLPKLRGQLSYSDSYSDREYNNAIPDRLHNEGISASLTLSVPLYSGGGISASARQAHYSHLQLRDESMDINREIMQSTHSIYLSAISGVSEVNARRAAIASSQSALAYAKKGYEQGIRTMINVLDAENIVYQASQSYSDALYEYLISGLRLKEMAGTLSVKDIEILSSQLDKQRNIYLPSYP